MSVANDHTVSAPAQANDSYIAATSAQLQREGNRDDSDKVEHGSKPAVETQRRTPKDSDRATFETLGEEQKI